jgi:hypothetical protein
LQKKGTKAFESSQKMGLFGIVQVAFFWRIIS